MMANMMTSFFEFEKLTTTVTRAKELRRAVERMITLGKRGDLNSRRQVLKTIHDRKVVAKLFEVIAPRFQAREGGYTRIMRLNPRQGDNAPMAIIELVEEELTLKPKKVAVKLEQPKAAVVAAAVTVEVAETPAEEIAEAPAEEVTEVVTEEGKSAD
jgi:large subunit ribosomal protein L17